MDVGGRRLGLRAPVGLDAAMTRDPSRVFVARNGRHELTNLMLSWEQVDELVERVLKSSGGRSDPCSPWYTHAVRPPL